MTGREESESPATASGPAILNRHGKAQSGLKGQRQVVSGRPSACANLSPHPLLTSVSFPFIFIELAATKRWLPACINRVATNAEFQTNEKAADSVHEKRFRGGTEEIVNAV